MNLTNVEAKCTLLFRIRTWKQYNGTGSLTRSWLENWTIYIYLVNPPDIKNLPRHLEYVRTFIQEWSYISTPRDMETQMNTKRKVYRILHDRCMRTRHGVPMSIMQCKPSPDLNRVWANTHQPFQCTTSSRLEYDLIKYIYKTQMRTANVDTRTHYNTD